MTDLISKSFRWIVLYRNQTWRYNNFLTQNDVLAWEKQTENIDNVYDIIPNPLYEEVKQPNWD